MTSTSSSSKSFKAFRRTVLGFGGDHTQVHSEEVKNEPKSLQDRELDEFQDQVFSRFNPLSASSADDFLSIDWMCKLLDAFVACLEDFKLVLLNNENVSKPPLDRLLMEFYDRNIKALDICNAVRDGIEKVRVCNKHLEIVSSASDSKQRNAMSEWQFRRARKALNDLAILMLDDHKDSGSVSSHRNQSFGRPNKGKDVNQQRKPRHTRSFSWSVSNSCSANRQLQSISNDLVQPRVNDIPHHFVLKFVLWNVVAAIPCQDRGLFNFSVPRQYSWSGPLFLIQTRVLEESKKRERKNSPGLLSEIY
ncbi:hypothetical protein HanRHA438_Chr16g0775411 [Helianthus annuus]|nr:hypothetical protein HanRHA438_Chr16g0775411 [Helianthus annuus]